MSATPSRGDARREALAGAVADHLLAHGLGASGLRALARAAGTSDRMLLYYFRDKDDLLGAALGVVVERMEAVMEPVAPAGARLTPDHLLALLAEAQRSEALGPAMRLWIEMVAQAALGAEPWRGAAAAIAERSMAWIAARLDSSASATEAARVHAMLDAAALLDALGRRDLADLALGRARPGALALATEPRDH